MNKDWPAGVHPIRGVMSVMHLLVDEGGAVLIDAGFPWDAGRIRHAMARLGLEPEDLRAVLLTHGHIDHAGCAAWVKQWSGAPVHAHPLEQAHINGTHPYHGLARVTGALEAAGRRVTAYQPTPIDVALADGDELPFWGGLKVVHLPGHTFGHCGFHSARHDVLFTGDLWVRFMMRTQTSPRVFSDDVSLVRGSMRKARAVGARWVIPGHYGMAVGTRLKRRFEELGAEIERRRPVV